MVVFSGYVGDNPSYLSYRIKNYRDHKQIKVNGEMVEPLQLLEGTFIGLNLPQGSYDIEFRYHVPGLKTGAIISIISLLLIVDNVEHYVNHIQSISALFLLLFLQKTKCLYIKLVSIQAFGHFILSHSPRNHARIR